MLTERTREGPSIVTVHGENPAPHFGLTNNMGPLTFTEYVSYMRDAHPILLGGIYDVTHLAIQRRRDRGIAILEEAPGTLTYDERISLLVGDLRMHHRRIWPKHLAYRGLTQQDLAVTVLRPWLQQYQDAWKLPRDRQISRALWKEPPRRYGSIY